VKVYKKFSISFACLVIGLIGISPELPSPSVSSVLINAGTSPAKWR